MAKKILIGLGIVVALFLIFIALQPSEFQVRRQATIQAPPIAVFSLVNDFHNWEKWSPWAKLDPQAKNTFEGAPAGTGAIFSWAGNDQVGEGRMTITDSQPLQLVRIQLEFLKPWAATNLTEFTFQPGDAQTVVTWTMSGHNGFVQRLFCFFMNMDKMVGGDFEKGLAQMKAIAESAPSVPVIPDSPSLPPSE